MRCRCVQLGYVGFHCRCNIQSIGVDNIVLHQSECPAAALPSKLSMLIDSLEHAQLLPLLKRQAQPPARTPEQLPHVARRQLPRATRLSLVAVR